MCHFLELAIHRDQTSAMDVFPARELHISQEGKLELSNHIPNDFVTFTVTSNGCSCDLYTGNRDIIDTEKEQARKRAKYKKKGWSEAKIERALNEEHQQQQSQETFRADVKLMLTDLLRRVDSLYILCHWVDAEVKEKRQISKASFNERKMPITENEVVLIS